MRYIARDVSDFPKMIEGNYLYVDKTHLIYQLYARKERYHFLARPRRFGKSLLISTLKELFSGNRKLFQGLSIESSDFDFTEHPIVHIDFSTFFISHPKNLCKELRTALAR